METSRRSPQDSPAVFSQNARQTTPGSSIKKTPNSLQGLPTASTPYVVRGRNQNELPIVEVVGDSTFFEGNHMAEEEELAEGPIHDNLTSGMTMRTQRTCDEY